MLDESPLGCLRPCSTISYQMMKYEFPTYNQSKNGDIMSAFFINVQSTDVEVHEDYILVVISYAVLSPYKVLLTN